MAQEDIFLFLNKHKGQMFSSKDIGMVTGVAEQNARRSLNSMEKYGEVEADVYRDKEFYQGCKIFLGGIRCRNN